LRLALPVRGAVLELEVTVCRVADLLPHEEVVADYLERLKRALSASAYQHNPVVVDAQSNVILDGTHRWAAMRDLGFEWIAACKVDYSNPLVELDSWARAYPPADGPARRLLERLGASPLGTPSVSESSLAVVGAGWGYEIAYSDLADAFRRLRELERELQLLTGRAPTYVPRSSWERYARGALLLLPPKPSKAEVVRAAREGRLLPPKSTRHVIPARPVRVNVPLKLLRSRHLDPALVDELLKQKRMFLLEPPVVLDREYQELLLLFA